MFNYKHRFEKCWKALGDGGVPVSLPSPLVWLCRVWVDLDGSVTVSDGCIWFLHLDIDTENKDVRGGGGVTFYFENESLACQKQDWTPTLLSWHKEQLGRGST